MKTYNTEAMTLGYETYAPGTVEIYGNLKFVPYELAGKPILKIYQGKQSKPYYHHSFPGLTLERKFELREQAIAHAKGCEDARVAEKAKRKAEVAVQANTWKVGDLLSYSWGYEQTNVEYFQVVKVLAKMVHIRPIGGRIVRDTGWASSIVSPVPDSFKSEKILKKMLCADNYLVMRHGIARRVTENSQEHTSSYA